jgi:hypothetical protein
VDSALPQGPPTIASFPTAPMYVGRYLFFSFSSFFFFPFLFIYLFLFFVFVSLLYICYFPLHFYWFFIFFLSFILLYFILVPSIFSFKNFTFVPSFLSILFSSRVISLSCYFFL